MRRPSSRACPMAMRSACAACPKSPLPSRNQDMSPPSFVPPGVSLRFARQSPGGHGASTATPHPRKTSSWHVIRENATPASAVRQSPAAMPRTSRGTCRAARRNPTSPGRSRPWPREVREGGGGENCRTEWPCRRGWGHLETGGHGRPGKHAAAGSRCGDGAWGAKKKFLPPRGLTEGTFAAMVAMAETKNREPRACGDTPAHRGGSHGRFDARQCRSAEGTARRGAPSGGCRRG
jgi:hypothetical protein